MAKIHIQPLHSAASSTSSSSSSAGVRQGRQQAYTVWMKSLVFNGNGCTVYGPDGAIAFRVDNYGRRGGREVFFMDHAGKTLVTIRRKGFWVFKRWEVCRCAHGGDGQVEEEQEEDTPWFSVRRDGKGGAAVAMHGVAAGTSYRIDGCCSRKPEFRVLGVNDEAVAEVARKQTAAGVVLGEDVLTLTVAPDADHLLALGLVVVRGLMNRSM